MIQFARRFRTVTALALGLSVAFACSSPEESEDGLRGRSAGEGVPVPQERSNPIEQLAPGTYIKPARDDRSAVLVFEGVRGGTLDLRDVELRGQRAGEDLDAATGFGIFLVDCTNVTIRGGLIGGYKSCIVVEGCSGITIENVRFDGWYGQRLRSTSYAEDLSDWLRPHENDQAEWLSNYGGAISITDSTGVLVRGCRGRRGQNGILLTRVDNSEIYDNDFSFLSGWGLGMYRSSDNIVSHNVFDYCVRGYSHDVYWRGQDSAGILMFEQCSRNLVARNSATHGGDGVFLYAGQDLVDRGLESATGSDDNVFFENDLRFAVANSFEGTFSRGNAVVYNDLSGSHQHGLWGGYAQDMVVIGNEIDGTIGGGVTIEHGQGCLIADNRISNNEVGIELYWDEDPEIVGGAYGQVRDTLSRGHSILQNKFKNNVLDFVLRRTTGIVFHANEYEPGTREPYFENVSAESDPSLDTTTVQRWLDALDGSYPSGNLSEVTLDPWVGIEPPALEEWRGYRPPRIPGSRDVRAEERDEFGGGLESIVMGEWGPWDFRSGEPRPKRRRPGGILASSRWQATWFRWKLNESDPRTATRAWRNRAAVPLVEREVGTFTNPWAEDDIRRQVGNDFFGLFAETSFVVDRPGTYALSVQSDDGVRVFLDGEVVLEDWSLHAPKRDDAELTLTRGRHLIRLEYFQIQGAAALVVDLREK
ncbi:MAG: right-handed parallel beta-helix repeat-containing protein [Planctomycetota bacterium]